MLALTGTTATLYIDEQACVPGNYLNANDCIRQCQQKSDNTPLSPGEPGGEAEIRRYFTENL